MPPPVKKPDMILPKINTLVGGTVNPPDIWEEITQSYAEYSRAYWAKRTNSNQSQYKPDPCSYSRKAARLYPYG